MQDFKHLKVWEKAHALTLDVYKSSKAFPREENVRFDKPDASGSGLDRSEHC